MKLCATILILAFARTSFAFTDEAVCADCEYSDGLGYVPGINCLSFYQCVQNADGSVGVELLCCAEGEVWKQEYLTCVAGACNGSRDECPVNTLPPEAECPLKAVEDPAKFGRKDSDVEMDCPVGTVFNESACSCVHGGNETCFDDPLLYFPFAFDFNDIQCHKVVGTAHGDAVLDEDQGCVRLDGDGDYVSFGFLNNWFANNNPESFTISIWFNQSMDGFLNLNNFPYEGVFGNGECDQSSSIWITTGNATELGGVRTDGDEALFEWNDDFGDLLSRDYNPPEVWCQFAIRYTKTEVTLFLNGNVTAVRPISGELKNTQAASTIGLAFFDCLPYFWTGCLDDLMVFDRYVSDLEMYWDVFGRDRTPGGIADPYDPWFGP